MFSLIVTVGMILLADELYFMWFWP